MEEVEEVEEVEGEILNVSKFLRLTAVCLRCSSLSSLSSLDDRQMRAELGDAGVEITDTQTLSDKLINSNRDRKWKLSCVKFKFHKLLSVFKTFIMRALILILISYFCCNYLKFA